MIKSDTKFQRAPKKETVVLFLASVFFISGCVLGLFSCFVLGLVIVTSGKQVTASIEREPIPIPAQISEDWLLEQAFKTTRSQNGFAWSQFTQPSRIIWETYCSETGVPKLVMALVELNDLNNVNQHAVIRIVNTDNNQSFIVNGYIMGATLFSGFGTPHPTINMARIGFKGNQAIQLAIDNGGNVFHQKFGERCRVNISIDSKMKWYVTYYEVDRTGTPLCFEIDAVLSNPTATINPTVVPYQCK